VFCQKCGGQLHEQSRFCSNCGEKVLDTWKSIEQTTDANNVSKGFDLHNADQRAEEIPPIHSTVEAELAATAEVALPQEEPFLDNEQTKGRFLKKVPILIPVISILLAGGGVSASYFHETNKNEEVLVLQQSAETAALNGEFTKAEKELERALHMRPDYAVLQHDLEAVRRASHYTSELTSIDDKMKEQNFTEAEADLSSFKETVELEVDPLFESFAELIAAREVTITVGKIKQQLSELTTVQELADKLNKIAALSSEEAASVKEQILMKIVQISSNLAEEQLQNKQFSAAMSSVNQGLEYATDHKTLLFFKDKIEQEQAAFEQAEQTRLEQAMEAAAREDLQNRTAAVEVTSFDYEVDEFGDLYVYGEITNVATKDISSITIDYSVYDLEGTLLNESSTTVYPFYVVRGEQGAFEDVVFYLFQEVDVEIDNITWYVE
jgi:tetratricopeptide (TPR) repeat protein